MYCNVWHDKNLCGTNLCDWRLTCIICINKTHTEKCWFMVIWQMKSMHVQKETVWQGEKAADHRSVLQNYYKNRVDLYWLHDSNVYVHTIIAAYFQCCPCNIRKAGNGSGGRVIHTYIHNCIHTYMQIHTHIHTYHRSGNFARATKINYSLFIIHIGRQPTKLKFNTAKFSKTKYYLYEIFEFYNT